MEFSDALDREAAWLSAVDSLPSLLSVNGGPFQTIQARWPRTLDTLTYGIYVVRAPGRSAHYNRTAAQRQELITSLQLRCVWPLTSGVGSAENDQLAFDQAIDKVLTRVLGNLGDHTHGGRFAWAAEDGSLDVDYADPAQAVDVGTFTARITYLVADLETNI